MAKKLSVHVVKKGVMIAVGDFKTTKSFHCDSCKKRLNID
jgi:hypothetical protein